MEKDGTLTSVIMLNREYLESEKRIRKPSPFRIDHGAFVYITKGSGRIAIGMREYDVAEHDFLTVLSSTMVRVLNACDDFSAYAIIFSHNFTYDQDLWKNTLHSVTDIIENPVLRISPGHDSTLINSYCAMLHEIHSSRNITFRDEIMKNMLEAVMFAVSGFYRDLHSSEPGGRYGEKLTRNHEIIKDFLALVATNYDKEREVAFYADKLYITPKHLGYVIKSVSGELASDAIAKVVIMDAKGKLKSTNLSVRQISDSLNFPNPSFFGKYFKKHVGVTPKDYRDRASTD